MHWTIERCGDDTTLSQFRLGGTWISVTYWLLWLSVNSSFLFSLNRLRQIAANSFTNTLRCRRRKFLNKQTNRIFGWESLSYGSQIPRNVCLAFAEMSFFSLPHIYHDRADAERAGGFSLRSRVNYYYVCLCSVETITPHNKRTNVNRPQNVTLRSQQQSRAARNYSHLRRRTTARMKCYR